MANWKEGCGLVGCGFLIFLGGMWLIGVTVGRDKPKSAEAPKPSARVKPPAVEAKPAKKRDVAPSCILDSGQGDGDVPVLPTEAGYDEFSKAVARSTDGHARNIVFRQHGGFWVSKGTPCAAIDTGFVSSHVRVLEGPHAGKAGWVPNEWRVGK